MGQCSFNRHESNIPWVRVTRVNKTEVVPEGTTRMQGWM